MQVKRQLSKERGSEGRKERKSERRKAQKIEVKEMIKASATMLRNVHADSGTEGLLAYCTGRPHASQTPHGCLGLLAPMSSVTGTTWLACHLASLVREEAGHWKASLHHSPQLPSSHLGFGGYHSASPRVLSAVALPGRQREGHLQYGGVLWPGLQMDDGRWRQ